MADQFPPAPSYPTYPDYAPRRQSFRWWKPILYAFLSIGLFVFTLILIIALGLVALVSSGEKGEVELKEHTVLRLHVNGPLGEHAKQSLNILGDDRGSVTFLQALTALRKAKTDPQIDGIYFTAGDLSMGSAKADEFRTALLDFKKSGKFVYAFIEAGTERDYYFASVADSIFMPSEGLLEMNGFGTVAAFYKGFLDKIGVKYEVAQFEEYKSAPEVYLRKNFSGPAREELRDLIRHRHEEFVKAVSESRNLDPQKIRSLLAEGVYDAESMLKAGLITDIRAEQRVRDAMRDRTRGATQKAEDEKTLRMIGLESYINSKHYRSLDSGKDSEKQIAVIVGAGTIISGGDSDNPFDSDGGMMTAHSMIKYLRKARENKKVKAIILRIDSPGGSVIASEAIWEEIQKTRAVKPVYASMSDYAASGGYYIAMPCDTIIAHPNTITGSIGVFVTIPNAAEMIDKIGVSVDTITSAPHALFLDPAIAFTPADRAQLYKQAEGIYKRFVTKVASARGMQYEEARSNAKGRVWLGSVAKTKGLVDTLGGLQTAIDIAKRRIGVETNTSVAIRLYPESKKLREVLLESILDTDDANAETGSIETRQSSHSFVALVHVYAHTAFSAMTTTAVRSEVRTALDMIAPGMGAMTEQMFLRIQQAHWQTLRGIVEREHTMIALPYLPVIQ